MGSLTRRQFIAVAGGLSLAVNGLALPASGLTINPRSAWGANLPPLGPLPAEDVKFLIVHHAGGNGRASAEVPGILRGWFDFHTTARGWNDIAYNFIIDSEGAVWEGRQGSLSGAIAGDATGGNQGFSQLVCVMGNFNEGNPTALAIDSLKAMLAWLADRYGVPTTAGSEVTFTSKGSNRWPAGTVVTTPTINGHRDMSKTSCPGESLYSYVAGSLMADVDAARNGVKPAPTTTSSTSTTVAPTTTTTVGPPAPTAPLTTTSTTNAPTTTTSATLASTTTAIPSTSTSLPPSSTTTLGMTSTSVTPSTTIPVAAAEVQTEIGIPSFLVGSAALVAAGGGLLLWRKRRMEG